MNRNLNICVTGACGKIAYSLYNSLCTGYVFGENISLELRLLDVSTKMDELKILKEELDDCCYTNVASIKIFDEETEKDAFLEADVVIFLGGMARKPGM